MAREANALPDDKYGCRELASVWSLAGDRVQGLQLLHRALAAGYASVSLFDDEDLAALRGGAEFEAIAAEVRRRIGQTPALVTMSGAPRPPGRNSRHPSPGRNSDFPRSSTK